MDMLSEECPPGGEKLCRSGFQPRILRPEQPERKQSRINSKIGTLLLPGAMNGDGCLHRVLFANGLNHDILDMRHHVHAPGGKGGQDCCFKVSSRNTGILPRNGGGG